MVDNLDYGKLKLKCGLEIHQQLDTNKLFCDCPSVLRQDEPDFVIKRNLHAVAGESGEVDIAAKYQASLNKDFLYEGFDTTCLVELDEEPPHEINQHALKIAVQIAILLNCKIIPITQIMRKTVIDGSNTSGFQRTVLIAKNGYVDTEQGRVNIEGICLEEDAARIVLKKENTATYRLDRLGIPLVEITTAPDIKTPEQAKEVALFLGDVLRSCKVKRGIGTIRQDVNLSIRNENRIELKGMQNMNIFIKVIENEILRQKKLSDLKKPTKLEVRNALSDGKTEFLRPMPGSARMYPETDLPLLKISRDFINEAKKSLPKALKDIKGELRKQGLSQEIIKILFKQNKLKDFKELVEIVNNPVLVARTLLIFPKEVSKHFEKSEKIQKKLEDSLSFIFEAVRKKQISENQIKIVMERIAKGEDFENAIIFEKQDVNKIEEKIMNLIKKKSGLSEKAYMGLIMKEFKGKLPGKELMEIIKKYI